MTAPHRALSALLLSAALSTVTLTTLAVNDASAADRQPRIKVDRIVFPVTLADGNTYNVVGYLYYEGSVRNRTLQVLVHGITYTHAYWDIPSIHGYPYSYARYMADQRYAVLALDLLGTGESSRPDGDFTDLGQTAESVHQVLDDLRTPGGAFATPFDRIALVGHSNGSLINTLVQSRYGDADALVNTGFVFTPHALPVDPADVAALLASPYVALPPATRTALFYDTRTADPAVIDYDNANLADTLTRGQLRGLLAVAADPTLVGVADVTGPVLVQLAARDVVEPASYLAAEAALYTSADVVTPAVVPGAGHSINGHFAAPIGWVQIDGWLRWVLSR